MIDIFKTDIVSFSPPNPNYPPPSVRVCASTYILLCVCACSACAHTQCRICVPLGIMIVSRYASAVLDHTSVPAKMALPLWMMVAAAVVSVCLKVFVQVLLSLCSQSHVLMFLTSSACSNAATDVVFLIDGSKSVRPENFELVKKWINQIIDKLDVSDSKAHVGLVQYSSSIKQVQDHIWSYFFFSFVFSISDVFPSPCCRSSPWAVTTTRRT